MAVSVLATESEVNMSGSMVQKKDWKSADAHISLITIVGGGHTIPQGNFRFRRILGMTLEDDSILESILNSMFAIND
jgi:poly(3-hydroxybutyrate) depolymerase